MSTRVWESEPDEVSWYEGFFNIKCRIKRHPRHLHLCGYIYLPLNHPWIGLSTQEVPAICHGGITFSEPWGCAPCIGFDCAHLSDFSPGFDGYTPGGKPYRDMVYARKECISLVEQCVAVITKDMLVPL